MSFQKNVFCEIRGGKNLNDVYVEKRSSYSGSPFTNDLAFDAELTESIIKNMKRGKAAGLDGITAEHLQHCHPSLPTLLAKLFNLIMETGINGSHQTYKTAKIFLYCSNSYHCCEVVNILTKYSGTHIT